MYGELGRVKYKW